MSGLTNLGMDAVPQRLPVIVKENVSNKIQIEALLSDFHADDYKSLFFLLMDFVGQEEFLSLTKKNEPQLKNAFIDLYHKHSKYLDDSVLLELLGTLKMNRKLRMFGTCSHVYESQEKKFNRIHRIWKILYSLCEELTDSDVEILKQNVPPDLRDQILSAEDWFCWALQNELFSRTNLFNLEKVFENYPRCLNIIKSYKDFELYDLRMPTGISHCGIAVIINYDKFNENSRLERRVNSHRDVASLMHLWDTFGFKVDVCSNLTCSQTFEKMKYYASEDHSNYDVFVCCILSHGHSNAVYSSDGELMDIPELIDPVVSCISLNKKPKLFFIQACQGTNIHQGPGKPIYQMKTANTSITKSYDSSKYPIYCDVLEVKSSIDGYVSFRDEEGSWFIQTLCTQLMQDGDNSSIVDVMTKVSEEVRNKYSADFGPSGPSSALQIVPFSSTLGKKLILKKRSK